MVVCWCAPSPYLIHITDAVQVGCPTGGHDSLYPTTNAELEFVLNQTTSPPDNSEVKFCTAVGLVAEGEIESPTCGL